MAKAHATGVRPTRGANRAARVLVWVGLLVVVLVTVWWFVLSSPAERSARTDVARLSSAVSDFVESEGGLPRITVAADVSESGESIWGAAFLVESRSVERADSSRARIVFLVGDAADWCVEAQYVPPSLFSDSSGVWVSARGRGTEVGKVVDGRCDAGYVLVLSPVTEKDVPEPGTVIEGAIAPLGTCFTNPFSADASVRPRDIEVAACTSGHFGEIFFTGTGGGEDFGEYEETAAGSCSSALTDFIGVPRNLSALTAEPFTVDETAWDTGRREFSCFLFLSADDYPIVGSARDSWR